MMGRLLLWVLSLVLTHGKQLLRGAESNLERLAISKGQNRPEDTIAFVLFDYKYADMFSCWAAWFHASKSHLKALDVVVLDKEAEEHMKRFNADHPGVVRKVLQGYTFENRTYAGPDDASLLRWPSVSASRLKKRWPSDFYQRVIWASILELMKDGENVWHIDTDAFVYGNLWSLFKSSEQLDADLIGTCDHFGPGGDEWDCSLNPGVMFFRNSPAMQSVIRKLLYIWETGKAPEDEHWKSDMFMLNSLLLKQHCTWKNLKEERHGSCSGLKVATFLDGVNRGQARSGQVESPEYLETCRKDGTIIVHARNGYEVSTCKNPPSLS